MRETIDKEENARDLSQQYPYGDHLALTDSIAEEMDLLPDFEALKQTDPESFDLFWNYAVFPAQYTFKEDKESAVALMKRVKSLSDRNYQIEEKEQDFFNFSCLAREFNKYYKLNDSF